MHTVQEHKEFVGPLSWFHSLRSSSPVPEAVSGEEGSRLHHVELEQDLQQVEGQEGPFRVGDHRVLLVQPDEDGVDQDDQVVCHHEGPVATAKKLAIQSISSQSAAGFHQLSSDEWTVCACVCLTGVGPVGRGGGWGPTSRKWGTGGEGGVAWT